MRVLVDTSVWVAHFRSGEGGLAEMLTRGAVLIHPFVLGELACGNLKHRNEILTNLSELPSAVSASHTEVFQLVEARKLWGRGIGWIDAHLLASALLSGSTLWTRDEHLADTAERAGVKLHERR
jgi:predicted nucleic acid-binding protein